MHVVVKGTDCRVKVEGSMMYDTVYMYVSGNKKVFRFDSYHILLSVYV